jgi:hypothetical protein
MRNVLIYNQSLYLYFLVIHGRLLTAWSAAGIFGPVIVNYIREARAGFSWTG